MTEEKRSVEELVAERKNFIKENFIELSYKAFKLFIRKEDVVNFLTDSDGNCYINYRYVGKGSKIRYRFARIIPASETAEMIRKSVWWSTRFNVE